MILPERYQNICKSQNHVLNDSCTPNASLADMSGLRDFEG